MLQEREARFLTRWDQRAVTRGTKELAHRPSLPLSLFLSCLSDSKLAVSTCVVINTSWTVLQHGGCALLPLTPPHI